MRRGIVTVLVALGLVAGCTGDDPEPSPSPTGSTSTPTPDETAAPEDDAAVTVVADHRGSRVRVDVHPLLVSGDSALLTVDYTLESTGAAPVAVGTLLKPATGPIGTGGVRVVDLDAARVHLTGEDSAGQPAATREALALTEGETVTSHNFVSAPQSDTVAVLFPYLGLVSDVPVRDGEHDVTPEDLGRSGELSYLAPTLDSYTVGYDSAVSARVTADEATVAISSDVLFATDEHALTADAHEVVVDTAAEIAGMAEGGQVTVVGHTDDVASDEYNQALSERRAAAVSQVLTAELPAGFTVTSEGRGESEPAVPGTSDEARAANRRVEIVFTATQAGAAVDVDTGGPVPDATGVTTSAAPAEVPLRSGSFTISVESVERVEPYLVGTLVVERSSGPADGLLELFGSAGQGLDVGRGLTYTTLIAGAHGATLLGESSRYFPVDYVRDPDGTGERDMRATLADQFLAEQLAEGESLTVTVLWPDPGGDTVTLDVVDRFRITDVPVE